MKKCLKLLAVVLSIVSILSIIPTVSSAEIAIPEDEKEIAITNRDGGVASGLFGKSVKKDKETEYLTGIMPDFSEQKYLVPSESVNYDDESKVVQIANELCEGKSKEQAKKAICRYMTDRFCYDYILAFKLTQDPYKREPDIDRLLERRTGICTDFAAATVAMLRSQGIPAVYAVGYADGKCHAFVLLEENGQPAVFDPVAKVVSQYPSSYRVGIID